jgi:hypothetical protein
MGEHTGVCLTGTSLTLYGGMAQETVTLSNLVIEPIQNVQCPFTLQSDRDLIIRIRASLIRLETVLADSNVLSTVLPVACFIWDHPCP